LPPTEPTPGLLALLREASRELERGDWVLLACAACLPVVYVYQGTPGFFLAHLAGPGDPLAELWAELWRFGAVLVLFFLVPFAAGRWIGGRPLAGLGLRVGDWRAGLRIVAAALALLVPLLWLASASPAMQQEYPLAKIAARRGPALFAAYEAAYGLYYLGWEALFRGALQLGLRPRLGLAGACMVQLLPSVLLHIGKPAAETWGAVVAAPLFGAVAVRTGSFLPLFFLHWGIGVLNDLFCALRQGLL